MKFPLNYKKTAILSLAALVFAVINGFVLFPRILSFVLKHNLRLVKGSQVRPLFDKIPFPLTFKVYVFNITNSEAVINGEKPILSEIGPYIFDEWKIRENIVDDEKKDTVTYTMKDRFFFRPDLSNGLTGDEKVFFPNLVIVGGLMAVKRDRAAMLTMVSKAINSIFKNTTTPFINIKVMDLLFNGFVFECDGKDFIARTLCNALKNEGTQILSVNETFLSVSMLGQKNLTELGRFTVFRGKKNSRDLGRIISINDESSQSVWDGDECNRYIGTDSTIFPPFLAKDEGLWTFTPDICMSLKAVYVKKSSYAGFPTSQYTLDFGDLKNEPEKHCFCHDPPDYCPPRGTIDLMPCMGSPVFGSKPHFLDVDPHLLQLVEGLHPNRSKHDIFVNFESISGTPVEGFKRLQFSMQIEPIEHYEPLSRISSVFLPLLWIEESVQLNKTYTNLLKYQLFLAKKFNIATIWIGVLLGSAGFMLSVFKLYKEHSKKKATITTETSVSSSVTAEIERKSLDNMRYLTDRLSKTTKENEDK